MCLKWRLSVQGDILHKYRKEVLKQPSLFSLKHYHRPLVRSTTHLPVFLPPSKFPFHLSAPTPTYNMSNTLGFDAIKSMPSRRQHLQREKMLRKCASRVLKAPVVWNTAALLPHACVLGLCTRACQASVRAML